MKVSMEGPYLEIILSDMVQELLDRSVEQTVVVKLLGFLIGYKALCNKIQVLWKPAGSFQVIDVDNDYYLITFIMNQDYSKVLTEGPWMVYDNYLMV